MQRHVILCFFVFGSYNLWAHDTNTTHPRLTISAGTLIKNNDTNIGSYYDLYKDDENIKDDNGDNFPYLWGQDPRFTNKNDKDSDEKNDYPKFRHSYDSPNALYKKPRNTLDGVVMEDTPYNRVFSHFQHAYTGQAMHLDNGNLSFMDASIVDLILGIIGKIERSEDTAKRFFYDAVEIMGYLEDLTDETGTSQEPSKPLSFWLFGHALHHAEDMSSIAHVHNDVHITKGATVLAERDDYEGHFIPNRIYRGKAPWFDNASNVKQIGGFSDIWGNNGVYPSVPGSELVVGNLSQTAYNLATFQDDLEPPVIIYQLDFITGWGVNSIATRVAAILAGTNCGEGEIAQMFYMGNSSFGQGWDDGIEPELCGLYLERFSVMNDPHWVIRGASAYSSLPGAFYFTPELSPRILKVSY